MVVDQILAGGKHVALSNHTRTGSHSLSIWMGSTFPFCCPFTYTEAHTHSQARQDNLQYTLKPRGQSLKNIQMNQHVHIILCKGGSRHNTSPQLAQSCPCKCPQPAVSGSQAFYTRVICIAWLSSFTLVSDNKMLFLFSPL